MLKRIILTVIGVALFLPGLQARAGDDTTQKVRENLAYSIGVQAYIYLITNEPQPT